jgi:predicted secreted protein
MSRRISAGRGVLAAALLLLAAGAARGEGRTVTLTESFDGGMLTMSPGDQLVVKLGGNAGSGYSWVPAFNDASLLAPVGPVSGEAAAGGGGVRVFRFKTGASRGSVSLGFAWVKAGETEELPGRLFRAQIVFGPSVVPKHQKIQETDGGSRLYFTDGDTMIVRLPATASSGFGWAILRSSPILKPVGDPKFEPSTSNVPGAEGTQVIELRVSGPGAAWLELGYKRLFEKDSKPSKTWSVFVASAGLGK